MTPILHILAGAAVGGLAGYAYFSALWWNVGMFERGAAPKAIFVLVLRFALLAAVFIALAKLGALALLAGAGGLLAARRIVIRRVGKL